MASDTDDRPREGAASSAPRSATTVRAVDRTLEILKLFATSEHYEWTLDAIAQGTQLPKSTVHRLLETLHRQGFIEPGKTRGTYRLGTNASMIGHSAIRSRRPAPEVTALLTRVSSRIGSGIGLSVRIGDHALIVDRGSTGHAPSWRVGVGATLPCHSSAVGRALLAPLSDDEIRRIYRGTTSLPQTSPRGPKTVDELLDLVAVVRNRGYAIDDQQFEIGVRCIGVPVPGLPKDRAFALGLTLTADQLVPGVVAGLVGPMRHLAAVLSRNQARLAMRETHEAVVSA